MAPDEPSELSAVAQDYLKVIWNAQEWSREKVSTKMLAEKLGVSASTASESIRKLAEQGLVDHEKYGAVTLTDSGRRAALAMVRRHRLLETFLVNELGYGWDEVHDEAEVLEHAVSDRMAALIQAKLTPQAAVASMTTGRRFGGRDAEAIGIVDATAPEGAVAAAAVDMLKPLDGKDRGTLGAIKNTMFAQVVATLTNS